MAQSPVFPFTVELSGNNFSGGPIKNEKFLDQFSHEELSIHRKKRTNDVHITIKRDRIKKIGKKDQKKGTIWKFM